MTPLVFFALLGAVQQGSLGGNGRTGEYAYGGEERVYEHILTPGDKTDFKLTEKAGNVAILRVHSNVFDPAVEVVDASGKVIGSNDDVEPGVQDSRLLVVFPKDGEYSAHVLNYRSSSGGPYQLSVTRFPTQEATLDQPLDIHQEDQDTGHVRIHLREGEFIDCRLNGSGEVPRFISPSGAWASPVPLESLPGRTVLRAPSEGDYIATFSNSAQRYARASVSLLARRARVSAGNLGTGETRSVLPAGGIDIWTYHVAAGSFLRAEAQSPAYTMVDLLPDDGIRQANEPVTGYKGRNRRRFYAIKDCDVHVVVRGIELSPEDYKLTVSPAWSPWDGAAPVEAALRIGLEQSYGFEAHAGDLYTFRTESTAFDPWMSLDGGSGEAIATATDSGATDLNPTFTVAIPRTGRYYVRIGSEGNGGGGAFRLSAQRSAVRPLPFGQKVLLDPSETKNVFEFSAKENEGLILTMEGSATYALFAPDGSSVDVNRNEIPGASIAVFRARTAGKYRVWVRKGGSTLRVDALPL